MQYIATADLHFHNFRDFSQRKNRFEIQLEVLDQIISLAKQHKAEILFAGDLLHKRSIIYTKIFNPLFSKIANSGVTWILLPGNHDRAAEGGTDSADGSHSLEPFSALANCKVLYNSSYKDVYGLAPGHKVPPGITQPIVLAHGMINGAKNGFGFEFTNGYSVSDFENPSIKLVLIGDIHRGQEFGKVVIPGSAQALDFGDANDEKSVLLIKEDFSFERIPTKAPRFIILNSKTVTKELLEAGDDYNYYRIDLAANASIKTEKELREKIPNCVFTRQPPERVAKRVQLSAAQDDRVLLDQYHEHAKLQVDKKLFIEKGCEFLATGAKSAEQKGSARVFKFKRIWVENFMPFKKASHSFKEGVHLVTGTSDDSTAGSNGLGKSALWVDAIIFCLYGTLARSGIKSKDRVIHDPEHTGKGKDCAVGVEIDIGADSYEFIRARKHSKYSTGAVIIKNGTPLVLENAEAEIEQIIALPLEVLLNIAIFPQRTLRPNYKPFLACTDSERKDILENALSLGSYSAASDRVSVVAKTVQQSCASCDLQLVASESTLSATVQHADSLEKEELAFQTQREQAITSITGEITTLEAAAAEQVLSGYGREEAWAKLLQDLSSAAGAAMAARKLPVPHGNFLAQLKSKLIDETAKIQSFKMVAVTSLGEEARAELQEDITTLDQANSEKVAEFAEIQKALPYCPFDKMGEVRQLLKNTEAKVPLLESQKASIEMELINLSKVVEVPVLTCHTCGQGVAGESAAKTLEDLKLRVERVKEALKVATAQIAETKKLAADLTTELGTLTEAYKVYEKYQATVKEKYFEITKIRELLEARKAQLQEDDRVRKVGEATTQAMANLSASIGQINSQLVEATTKAANEAAANQLALQEATSSLATLTSLKELYEPIRAEVKAREVRLVQFRSSLEATKAATYPSAQLRKTTLANIELAKVKLKELQASREVLQKELKLLEALQEALGPKGLVSLILDGFLEEFQAITTQLCNDITLGSIQIRYDTEIELKKKDATGKSLTRDKFEVIIEKTHGGEGDLISGSEQQKCNLIIEQALSKLVASRSNIQVNLRVYDEVLDSLSATSIESVVKSLLVEEPGVAKYIVSHAQEIASMFTSQIQIEMKQGVSTLVS